MSDNNLSDIPVVDDPAGTGGTGTGGSGSGGTGGSGSGGTRGSGTGGSGSGGTNGAATGNEGASTTQAYHNGGVEGDGFADWYDANLAGEFPEGGESAAAAEQITVLDLSGAGAVQVIHVETNSDGTFSGTVEFMNANGEAIAWGHFDGVDQILPPDGSGEPTYTIEDLQVTGDHGEGLPLKVALDEFTTVTEPSPEEPDDEGGSGTGGSGSGGTGGSGTGGTGGSGSGGTGGSGSGGTRGSGSGGTRGSGTNGSGNAEISTAAMAGLPEFSPHEEDQGDLSLEDVLALMTETVGGSASGGTSGDDGSDCGIDFIA